MLLQRQSLICLARIPHSLAPLVTHNTLKHSARQPRPDITSRHDRLHKILALVAILHRERRFAITIRVLMRYVHVHQVSGADLHVGDALGVPDIGRCG